MFVDNLNEIEDRDVAFVKLIPLNFFINLFEIKNHSSIVYDRNYDKAHTKSFDSIDNPFWFIIYLNKKINFR